jgi:hypothetical protein
MTPPRKTPLTEEHLRLILEYARSVPHLEAVVLLWETAPQAWRIADIAARIYLPADATGRILQELALKGLVVEVSAEHYALVDDANGRELAGTIALAYRDNVSRVATLIHAGPSRALQDFAQAFELKERKE